MNNLNEYLMKGNDNNENKRMQIRNTHDKTDIILLQCEIDEKAIADLSIYLSKKMKDIILQKLSGRIEKVYFSYEMVESYFPNLSDKLVNKMLDASSKAWDKQLSVCEILAIK